MSVSNKFGPMLVTTGNKSEMSVGYATIYGGHERRFQSDHGSLQDAVFRLCRLRNEWKPDNALALRASSFPKNIIVKPRRI